MAALDLQETILRSFQGLTNYLDNQVSKTAVVNQLKEIGTPDAMLVVQAVEQLHQTLQTHENTDLTEVTAVMRELLEESRKIPKELPIMPEIPEAQSIDYTIEFGKLTSAIEAVEEVVKAQKLIAEAPVVNVPETQVKVDAPNLKPLQKGMTDVVKAVKAIVIPEVIFDTKPVEKLLKKVNKNLEDIAEYGSSGGSGGGVTSIAPFMVNGALPVSDTASPGYTLYDVNDSAPIYIGTNNDSDALTSASDWTIYKHTYSGANVTAIRKKTGVWDNRASIF